MRHGAMAIAMACCLDNQDWLATLVGYDSRATCQPTHAKREDKRDKTVPPNADHHLDKINANVLVMVLIKRRLLKMPFSSFPIFFFLLFLLLLRFLPLLFLLPPRRFCLRQKLQFDSYIVAGCGVSH